MSYRMPTCFVYVFFPSPSSLSNIPCRGIKKNISFHFLTRFVAAFTPLSSVFYCLDPFPLLLALSQLRSLRKILHRSFFEIIAKSSSQFYFYWLFFLCAIREWGSSWKWGHTKKIPTVNNFLDSFFFSTTM